MGAELPYMLNNRKTIVFLFDDSISFFQSLLIVIRNNVSRVCEFYQHLIIKY